MAGIKPHYSPEEIQEQINRVPYWFHAIELAPGIVTPGPSKTFEKLKRWELPQDMTGMRVLDIGAYEGFFTFECEKRGAKEVVAIDIIPLGPDSGFKVAHKILGSRAKFRYANIYDLNPRDFGYFDLVLCMGVLYHLRHPLLGLEHARSVCRGKFIVETQICDKYFINEQGLPVELASFSPTLEQMPMAQFYPGDELNQDASNWWAPNLAALNGMLKISGFVPTKTIENGVRACVHCEIDPQWQPEDLRHYLAHDVQVKKRRQN
jgi:tRNA (mo5U34)-methyltransferase